MRARTLGGLLADLAARTPGGEAVAFQGERLSWAELDGRARSFASALCAGGVRRGDRVAVHLPNRPEWLVALFGSASIGAVTVGVSTFSTARELGWTLEHADPSVLVTSGTFRGGQLLRAVHEALPEVARSAPGALASARVPSLKSVVALGTSADSGALTLDAFLEAGAAAKTRALAAASGAVTPDDPCYILYTSGSTATPKGVVLCHGRVLANGHAIGERQHLGPADRLWLAVPLFWSFGSVNALPAIATHGGTVVLQESFEAGEALELLERERCSVYYGMAHMARAMLEHPDWRRRGLATLRTGLTIGLPEDLELTMAALGVPELCNVYGSTETYGNCAVTDAHDPLELRLTTQGLPLPGMAISAVDPARGEPVPAGDVGELQVRGLVTPGYYRDPEATRAAFDAAGAFRTGDLGAVRPDGRIVFRGRLKEMIKSGGINVSPLEVEAVLASHPAVRQAAVVGVPDAVKAEVVAAAVELEADASVSPAGLVAFCRERLAAYKVPGRIVVLAAHEFPRTATGKLHKPGLRALLAGDERGTAD